MDGSFATVLLSWIATVLTVLLFCGFLPSFRQMWISKTVGDVPWIPAVTMFSNCMLWSCYGFLISNMTLILVNSIGLCCAIYCLGTYYCFATPKQQESFVQGLCVCCGGLLLVLLAIRYFVEPTQTVSVLGFVSSASSVALFGSPLVKLYHVVTVSKSAAGVPFSQSVLGLLCSGTWTLYGYVLGDWYMVMPNLLGCLLSLLQIGIFWAYRGGRPGDALLLKSEMSHV